MKNSTTQILLAVFVGFFLGIYLEAHHPQMFRSWDEADKRLYRGDKVRIVNLGSGRLADFYKGCSATFITSQDLSYENIAWVLLTGCDFQKRGVFKDPITDQFRLNTLERIK